ncbi:hypothetical protein Btru_050895 [Bulinus truncatus]|nr:hypothetical protein Btru_050895 [Bulinus truncatus]
MAVLVKHTGAMLLTTLSIGLVSTVAGHFFYCDTSPVVQRLLLFQCFWDEGITQASFSTLTVDMLCGLRLKFINAIRCQIQFLTRCHPDTASQAPSAELDGIPTFLEGICSTPGFNRTCYDANKLMLNSCIRHKLDKTSPRSRTQETLCPLLNKLATECVNQLLTTCGNITTSALLQYLPSARPSQCFTPL